MCLPSRFSHVHYLHKSCCVVCVPQTSCMLVLCCLCTSDFMYAGTVLFVYLRLHVCWYCVVCVPQTSCMLVLCCLCTSDFMYAGTVLFVYLRLHVCWSAFLGSNNDIRNSVTEIRGGACISFPHPVEC